MSTIEHSSTVVINMLFKNVELHSRRNWRQYLCFLFLIFISVHLSFPNFLKQHLLIILRLHLDKKKFFLREQTPAW